MMKMKCAAMPGFGGAAIGGFGGSAVGGFGGSAVGALRGEAMRAKKAALMPQSLKAEVGCESFSNKRKFKVASLQKSELAVPD